jgi:methionine-rich copper-binding protein CopC
MKRVMLAAVMALGTMTAFAQEEVTEEATANLEEVAAEAVEAQDGFNEVALEELPETITQALEAAHPGASVAKAYMNEQSQYKLEVTKEDGEQVELYADAEGNWIEM